MCVAGEQKCAFQTYTHMCSRSTHVCVCACSGRAYIYIYIYIYVCVCVFACAHMCVPHVHICAFAHMRVARVHICVFTCTHMCVLIRHVYVFQENTCLLSDEHVRVCLLPVHFFCMCVHVHTLCVHACAHVRSNWTRVCVPGGHMFVIR